MGAKSFQPSMVVCLGLLIDTGVRDHFIIVLV